MLNWILGEDDKAVSWAMPRKTLAFRAADVLRIRGDVAAFAGVLHVWGMLVAYPGTLDGTRFIFIHITNGIAHICFFFIGHTAILTYIGHGNSPEISFSCSSLLFLGFSPIGAHHLFFHRDAWQGKSRQLFTAVIGNNKAAYAHLSMSLLGKAKTRQFSHGKRRTANVN